jgi:hypothetical protein
MAGNSGRFGLFMLLAGIVAAAASSATPPGSKTERDKPTSVFAAGVSFQSAPTGDQVPFAESGYGVVSQYWYHPIAWGSVGGQAHWHSVGFDRGAFYDDLGRVDDGKLSASSFQMLDLALVGRLEPLRWQGWHPFLEAGLAWVQWKENYSYSDLTPGPWFPSGIAISRERTLQTSGWMVGGGIRHEGRRGTGFFVEASELVVDGDDLAGRFQRIQTGITWRL